MKPRAKRWANYGRGSAYGEKSRDCNLRPLPKYYFNVAYCRAGWAGFGISGAQEKAKDLISEALLLFKSQRQRAKVSEAQYELGMCYFRLGAYDEARVVLDEALNGLGEQATDLRAKILIRHTIIEVWTGRYHDAWAILEKAREFFES